MQKWGKESADELQSIGPGRGGKLSSGAREKGQLESLLEETGREWLKAGDMPLFPFLAVSYQRDLWFSL